MSKAEEEAERIVDVFKSNCWECGGLDTALSLALIHVEGIIDEIDSMDWEFSTNIADERREFWQEVKQELNDML